VVGVDTVLHRTFTGQSNQSNILQTWAVEPPPISAIPTAGKDRGRTGSRDKPMSSPLFHIVLLEPEIPNNTGNIGRTCAATACRLHVVHPIAFDMSEKARRRAGLDYWDLVDWTEHPSWQDFLETESIERLFLYTTRATRPHWDVEFRRGDYLLFGRESSGAPDVVHDWVRDRFGDEHRVTLPMIDDPRARSLNLATAVCTGIYEGMRQLGGLPDDIA